MVVIWHLWAVSVSAVIYKKYNLYPDPTMPDRKKNPRDRERIGVEDSKQDCLVLAEGAKYHAGSESAQY